MEGQSGEDGQTKKVERVEPDRKGKKGMGDVTMASQVRAPTIR
jgi:hypothetical protein